MQRGGDAQEGRREDVEELGEEPELQTYGEGVGVIESIWVGTNAVFYAEGAGGGVCPEGGLICVRDVGWEADEGLTRVARRKRSSAPNILANWQRTKIRRETKR